MDIVDKALSDIGVPTFAQSCKELRDKGWSIGEIADFEESTVARVRVALGLDEPQQPKGDGLLPYLGL